MTTFRKALKGGRAGTFAGGVAGLILFLVVGLLPSLVYGGYAGLALASALIAGPIHASLVAQAIVVFGMVAGVMATGALFVLFGSVLASGVFALLGGWRHGERGKPSSLGVQP